MTERFDVVVVGYGYAGAAAAIAASDAGAAVLLLERMPTPGGISICSAGGVRIADDSEQALAYLTATNGGKTSESVLRALAGGMTRMPERIEALGRASGAVISRRASPANYPFEGFETFGFIYVEEIPGFDPLAAYPHVAGAPAGAMLFKVMQDNVAARPIEVRCGKRAQRLLRQGGRIAGISTEQGEIGAGAVVLACGGFEADPVMQAQYWSGGPALNAAFAGNTGDGIRMAQAAGADLWHMWHYHGSYGFAWPDPAYPFGVRVKRLPDWRPGDGQELPVMSWILLDQDGRRFMNEYEPYAQDTGARPLGTYDPAGQRYPREPAFLVVDAEGLQKYPLGKPTHNDPTARAAWSADNAAEIAAGVLRRADTMADLAALVGAPVEESIARWHAQCAAGADDDFGRPPSSMMPIGTPPYYAGQVRQLVSNTQGGPVHDAEQRILDPFGQPIPGLYAAGELGSAFGHLYMSGGNLAECFVGGDIAGRNAAAGRDGDPSGVRPMWRDV
jgi:succinate dehydrogenase/fumarate reductase flavoprotein subunit